MNLTQRILYELKYFFLKNYCDILKRRKINIIFRQLISNDFRLVIIYFVVFQDSLRPRNPLKILNRIRYQHSVPKEDDSEWLPTIPSCYRVTSSTRVSKTLTFVNAFIIFFFF